MCDIYTTGCYNKKGSQPYDIRMNWQPKMDELPGWFGTPTAMPCPLKQLSSDYTDILGYSFNFYNNVWMTNYILWYPYVDTWPLIGSVDKNMKFRFEIVIT